MKIYTLNCFKNFKCIAEKCRHSCCIGWEIDIDAKSLKRYENNRSPFAEKLKNGIDFKNRRFKMTENGNCVFLNKNGLCDLIIALGENSLCNVCREHPRYRNVISGDEHFGIGLCCEVAAHAVVFCEKPLVSVFFDENDRAPIKLSPQNNQIEEKTVLLRKRAFEIFSNENKTFNECMAEVISLCGVDKESFFEYDWKKTLYRLERLFNDWNEKIINSDFASAKIYSKSSVPLNRLATYLVHRHVANAIDDTDIKSRLLFCVLSVFIINAVCLGINRDYDKESLADVARAYSAEIEYSDDNLNSLLDICDSFTLVRKF